MAASFEEYVVKIEAPDETVDQEELKFCQTCLSTCRIAVLKDMTRLYSHNGSYEKYSEMLYHCFFLKMAGYHEEAAENIYMICETCIEKLRIATDFRNCIEEAQQNIKQALENIPDILETIEHDHLYCTNVDGKNFSLSEDNDEQETENTTEFECNNMIDITSNPGILFGLDICDINNKEENNTDQNPYNVNITDLRKCYLCSETFKNYNSKRNHLINVHGVESPMIKCKQCNLTFVRPWHVTKHVQKVHPDQQTANKEGLPVDNKSDSDDDYFLDKLPSVLNNTKERHELKKRRILENHHLELVPNQLHCTVCEMIFLTHHRLKLHMAIHFPNFTCEVCGKVFAFASQLKHHKEIHLDKLYECSLCPGLRYRNSSNLISHKKNKHGSEPFKSIKCHLCGERFKYNLERLDHLEDTHGQKPVIYNCHMCSNTYKLKSALDTHLRNVHFGERNHICEICYRRFFSGVGLRKHMMVHTRDGNFPCKICEKNFHRNRSLIQHMMIHTGEKKYICDICKMAFTQKCTLKKHLVRGKCQKRREKKKI